MISTILARPITITPVDLPEAEDGMPDIKEEDLVGDSEDTIKAMAMERTVGALGGDSKEEQEQEDSGEDSPLED